jgi:hypothetical protein
MTPRRPYIIRTSRPNVQLENEPPPYTWQAHEVRKAVWCFQFLNRSGNVLGTIVAMYIPDSDDCWLECSA